MTLFAPERGRGPIHLPGQHPLPPSRTQVHDRAAAGSLPRRRAPRAFQHCARPRQDRVRTTPAQAEPTEGRPSQGGGAACGTEVRPESPPPQLVPSLRCGQGGRRASGGAQVMRVRSAPVMPAEGTGVPGRLPDTGHAEGHLTGGHPSLPPGGPTARVLWERAPQLLPTRPHCWRAEKTEVGPRSCLCPGSAPPPPALPETSSGCLGVLAVSVSPASLGRRAGHVQAGLGTAS